MARKNVWAGMAAGIAGGLAGSYAMGLVSKLSPPQGPDATERAGKPLGISGQAVHYGFGGLMGGLYGAVVAAEPRLQAGWGMPFGAALYVGAHGYAVPRLGLAESPMDTPLSGEAVELAAHLVYGIVTNTVRRMLA